MNANIVKVGTALFAVGILMLLASCNSQTINVTGNNNSVIQNNKGGVVGRDHINAPGVGEIARREHLSLEEYDRGHSVRPGCVPERPCCREDEVYFSQQRQSELMIRRHHFDERLYRAQRAPVRHERSQMYEGQGYRNPCPPGSRRVQTGGYHTRVYRDSYGNITMIEGPPPGSGAVLVGGSRY
jgi:hypothetical protein